MSSSKYTILAIETSCDETAVSVLRASDNSYSILSNIVSSQVKLHAKWGGVVPNLAAREHVKNLPSVLKMALLEAQILPAQIDAIAVTSGPGLIPALMVGAGMAKTLAYLWNKPLLGIHHIEGHIYANFVRNEIRGISNSEYRISNENTKKNAPSKIQNSEFIIQPSPNIKFPILCLVVSGGHTQLVLMKNHLDYEIIGQTLDDAAGEAFDKVARILNIGYPGGPQVAHWAAKHVTWSAKRGAQNVDDAGSHATRCVFHDIRFPRPMLNRNNFDFSFSGLKTAVLYETKKHPELIKNKTYIAQVCHEFQQAAIDVLVKKTIRAAEQYKPKTILLAGGVSANKQLREQLGSAINNHNQPSRSHLSYSIPDLSLTGDNAAMIACAAAKRWEKMSATQKKQAMEGWKDIQPDANLKLN